MEKYKEGLELLKKGKTNEAIKAFEASTSPDAKCQLGLLLIGSNEITKGIKSLEEAALANNPSALKTLITIYEKGMGVEVNYDKSSFYAKSYALTKEEGRTEFIKSIAVNHKDDKPTYLKYLQALCEVNDLDALYEAGMIIIKEAKDSTRGIEYLKKGANFGSKDCLIELASIYKEGLYNTKVNGGAYIGVIEELSNSYPEEVEYTDKLVEVYEKGLFGYSQDQEKAIQILRERASHEYSECIYEFRLAELKETGRLGVRVDANEAIRVYQSLFDRFPNNKTYLLKMAEIFANGKFGVTRDTKKAAQIYRTVLSKNQNDYNVIMRLAELYSKSGEAEEQKQAYEMFSQAFDANIREAGYYVVRMNYEGGIRYPKDYLKAVSAAEKMTQMLGNATLEKEEAEKFKIMKSLEIQMYENGGAKLPKNPRKAKEVLDEYNKNHVDKINIKKIKWN